jgi:hypothetical protein
MVASRGLNGVINGKLHNGTPASVTVSTERGTTYLSFPGHRRHPVSASALNLTGIENEAMMVFHVMDGVFTPH